MGRLELRIERRSDTEALSALQPHSPRLLSLVLLSSQLFSDRNVFHNKPSGAFPHSAGAGLLALLAATLLTSGKMCFKVCRFHGLNGTLQKHLAVPS